MLTQALTGALAGLMLAGLGGTVLRGVPADEVPSALRDVVGGEEIRKQCAIPEGINTCTSNWVMSSTCTTWWDPPCGEDCPPPAPADKCKSGYCSNDQTGRWCRYPNDLVCNGAAGSSTSCGDLPIGPCLGTQSQGDECEWADPEKTIPIKWYAECEDAPCVPNATVPCTVTACTGP